MAIGERGEFDQSGRDLDRSLKQPKSAPKKIDGSLPCAPKRFERPGSGAPPSFPITQFLAVHRLAAPENGISNRSADRSKDSMMGWCCRSARQLWDLKCSKKARAASTTCGCRRGVTPFAIIRFSWWTCKTAEVGIGARASPPKPMQPIICGFAKAIRVWEGPCAICSATMPPSFTIYSSNFLPEWARARRIRRARKGEACPISLASRYRIDHFAGQGRRSEPLGHTTERPKMDSPCQPRHRGLRWRNAGRALRQATQESSPRQRWMPRVHVFPSTQAFFSSGLQASTTNAAETSAGPPDLSTSGTTK